MEEEEEEEEGKERPFSIPKPSLVSKSETPKKAGGTDDDSGRRYAEMLLTNVHPKAVTKAAATLSNTFSLSFIFNWGL